MLEAKNIIAGKLYSGSTGEVRERRNPANGDPVSKFVLSSVEDLNLAVDSGSRAFEKSYWSKDPKLRSHIMRKMCDSISRNLDYLAKLQSLEVGKIIRDSRLEAGVALDLFDFYSGMARVVYGRTSLLDKDTMSFILREPVGLVGIISPWNSPLILLARSLAPALAAGNCVVIKPPSYSPSTIFEFLRIITEDVSELPEGVVNAVFGDGEKIGRELVRHPKINMLSFTGSTAGGTQVMQDAAPGIKRLSLELGGKTPNIILDDANFDSAILGAIRGSMLGSAGQQCFAGTRVIVHETIHQKFKKRISELLPTLRVGDPVQDSTDVGPVVSEKQVERVMNFVEKGKKEATLLLGGERLTQREYANGSFIQPTIFDEVPPMSTLAQEEIFGPVVSIITFSNVEELIEMANSTKYGLSAAIWTNNINKAFTLAKNIRAGVVWINMFGKNYSEAETGGAKQSGLGRLRGLSGLNTFTELKNVIISLSQ